MPYSQGAQPCHRARPEKWCTKALRDQEQAGSVAHGRCRLLIPETQTRVDVLETNTPETRPRAVGGGYCVQQLGFPTDEPAEPAKAVLK